MGSYQKQTMIFPGVHRSFKSSLWRVASPQKKRKFEVHGLFLKVFPKIWHCEGTLSICAVMSTFVSMICRKNFQKPLVALRFSQQWIMKGYSMHSSFALPPSRRVKLSFSSLQAQGSFLFITSNMDCTPTISKTRVLSNLAFKATLMHRHRVTNITQRLPWTHDDSFMQRHFIIKTKVGNQTVKLQNKW